MAVESVGAINAATDANAALALLQLQQTMMMMALQRDAIRREEGVVKLLEQATTAAKGPVGSVVDVKM